MKRILTNRKTFIRCPMEEIPEDKIIFYDIETTHQFPPYCKIKSIAVQYGFNGKPEMVDRRSRRKRFKASLADPETIKVQFNGINFDDIVLHRHGYFVHPQNRHDVYLMLKTINPNAPAYGLKFNAFYYLGDPHFPQGRLNAWCAKHSKPMHLAPRSLLHAYNKHDVNPQTLDLFRMCWDVVIRDDYWDAYLEDLMIGEPLEEMMMEGGIYLDRQGCWNNLQRLQKDVQKYTKEALELTDGKVTNANSSKQLAKYFIEEDKIQLALSDGSTEDEPTFSVKKSVLVALRPTNKLADCAYRIREANGTAKYFENYLNALEDETHNERMGPNWIPTQFSVSSARTRRFTSQSLYKLNFQNPNEKAKSVQLVPPGFLGFWFDATQIENVVHIYESKDTERRRAYEADPDWNEYVWLCNQILQANYTKDELDEKDPITHLPTKRSRSVQIPNWTLYKQYKTGKLGINFGMGIKLFCELFGLTRDVGEITFEDIHCASPAIRELQQRVAYDLTTKGYVEDVFRKRYSGPPRMAYKVVAYLIQGCGTGSLPKAQIRSNWETLRRTDKHMPHALKGRKSGVMCETTHDANGGRIDLRLGDGNILQLLQKMNYNMTERFSPLFDNIPLRAKMYLSRTNANEAEEISISDHKRILEFCN